MKKSKLKVYLAGGMSFHNDWRDSIIKENPKIKFLDPRNSGSNYELNYTMYDIYCIKECDVLFAYMDKTNPSGYGLSVELGLAFGLRKFIIFVDCTDLNRKKYFGMHRVMANKVFTDLPSAINFLNEYKIFMGFEE